MQFLNEIDPLVALAALAFISLALTIALLVGLVRSAKLKRRFARIVDVDKEVARIRKQISKREEEIEDRAGKQRIASTEQKQRMAAETRAQELLISQLRESYESKKTIYDALVHEVGSLEDGVEMASFGIYEPHFNFDTSDAYKDELTQIRSRQKKMTRSKSAATCDTEWTVEGSKAKGQRMIARNIKLMLRAFNGECDAALLKMKWNNGARMEDRIRKAFNAINKLAESMNTSISRKYLDLKTSELQLAHEYAEKKQEEKEEQRRIREEMREEERAQSEIDKALESAAKEEARYRKALDAARREAGSESSAEIERLQALLEEALSNKKRAVSRAQLTRSGHVYVISNIGSFGDEVFKIGMTRRLDPQDRVKELGDASVPFIFDVHAMIFSEDAPTLEKDFHRLFRDKQVNLVNSRKEFFRVSLGEIEEAATSLGCTVEFTRIAEAQQFRESLALLESRSESQPTTTVTAQFPSSI